MCGIAGFLDRGVDTMEPGVPPALLAMLERLVHRGPDAEGVWTAPGVALGHRRLSILDLTEAGHQPMVSASGRYVLVFNGEIYNHEDLRRKHSSYPYRGRSDTEALLAAIEQTGVAKAIAASVGMFAFAVWDSTERRLTLARDRFGEKPLYFTLSRQRFAFASELDALLCATFDQVAPDPKAIGSLLRYSYVPAPWSILAGVKKLEAGSTVSIDFQGSEPSVGFPQRYFSPASVMLQGADNPFQGTFEEAVVELSQRLEQAIFAQMIADVPLGAFLSGGIDSSIVVAKMQRLSASPIRTFSIGFGDSTVNEAPFAARVAEHIGTFHTEHYVTEEEALKVAMETPVLFDEPFADASQIPMTLVCRLARQSVSVALSGDGGDEMFWGYPKYVRALRFARLPARKLGHSLLSLVRAAGVEQLGSSNQLAPYVSSRKLNLLAGLLGGDPWRDYPELMATTSHFSGMTYRDSDLHTLSAPPAMQADFRREWMAFDLLHYLPDDIMTKVDRAAMSVSLETRAPLLDHRVFELAASFPFHFLSGDSGQKDVLKAALHRLVPRSLVERPKAGFSVPLGRWLRGPLRQWAQDQLEGTHTTVDLKFARNIFSDHLKGPVDHSSALWPVVVLRAWERERANRANS